ncbi:hypothetical protein LPB136_04920 [Tenacibaculum todarodis]|uniref:Glycerophosphoryl diester phosphodiesterase membrane domain-containing protein n=1 Tax=Tenacibaculum todarodis TaxID=1850252 RepID=A0A1L3JHX4_9FLAO|nr:hypothetical protein [Tenacibaculum todarodis]APG64741.1 hypothetical protein LPB136_04920 [Tenacibaculum todarodis]
MRNNNEYVEFKKERDLGAIITDTFKFFRLEWKPFFTTTFKIALIPILIALAGILYYSYEQSNLFSDVDWSNPNNAQTQYSGAGMVIATFVMFFSYLIAYIMINVAAMYYIKSYIDNEGKTNYEEIKQNVSNNLWAFVGLGFLVGIMVFVGMLFCVIPGIYVAIPLTLASSIYVFKGKEVMDAISYSFTFIKNHWWETFGVLIVVGLLIGVLGSIFSIPSIIYMLIKSMSGIGENDPMAIMSIFSDPIYLFLTVVSYVGRFLFYAVTLVSTVLIYFDINEQKYASGTIEQIDRLGE